MSQYDRTQETQEAMSLEAPGTNLPDYEPAFGAPMNWANWIEDMFWEMMRYVPNEQFCKDHGLYYCLDCGEPTSTGLHCDKR